MYEFDLKAFLKAVLGAKKRLFMNVAYAVVVAIIVAFSIPKSYTASASLASEMQAEGTMNGGISSLASMAGINLNASTDAIVPALYPDVVHSNKFLVDLLYSEVKTYDGELQTDYITYLKQYTRYPWWSYGGIWIGKILKKMLPKDDMVGGSQDGRINPFRMSKDDSGLLEKMRGNISCIVDEETQVITLSVQAQDPLVAAIMVDSVRNHLQNFITNYHTCKARVDLVYYQNLEKTAKAKYEAAQAEYAAFCDSHKGVVLQSYLNKQESLNNELQLAYTAYSQIKQQVQMAEAKVQERTPAFTEIEGVSVPVIADSPKKVFILVAFIFLSVVGTIAWIYIKMLLFKHESN